MVFRVFLAGIFLTFAEAVWAQNFTPYFAFSYQPVSFWGFSSSSLELDTEASYFTRAEFDIAHRSGIKLGVNIDFTKISFTQTDADDNLVDRFGRIMGKLGYKNLLLQVSNSHIGGTGHWNYSETFKETGVTQPDSFDFSNGYFSLDLLYLLPAWNYLGVGVNYTRFTLPYELSPYYVYDPEAGFPSYGVTLWIDHLFFGMQRKRTGFHLWLEDLSRMNFGPMNLSDVGRERFHKARESFAAKAEERGDDLYTTDTDYDSMFAALIQMDLNVGVSYVWKKINAGVAVGYGLMGQILFPFMGESQAGFRHGFVIKGSLLL